MGITNTLWIYYGFGPSGVIWAIVRGMIGVFDSGFGGLHVLKSVTTRHPSYGYIYLGDSARAPYGPRSAEEVYRFTKQGVEFLFSRGASLVVLACNTASSEALRKIQQEQLAEKCGTTKTYISRIENNASDIRLSTLMRIIREGLGGHLKLSVDI